jgi:hypothetical protein
MKMIKGGKKARARKKKKSSQYPRPVHGAGKPVPQIAEPYQCRREQVQYFFFSLAVTWMLHGYSQRLGHSKSCIENEDNFIPYMTVDFRPDQVWASGTDN